VRFDPTSAWQPPEIPGDHPIYVSPQAAKKMAGLRISNGTDEQPKLSFF
jgi:hypothetical protein